MIIIGEKINLIVKNVVEVIKNEDYNFIVFFVEKQVKVGVYYIDVNVGVFVDIEVEILKKMV